MVPRQIGRDNMCSPPFFPIEPPPITNLVPRSPACSTAGLPLNVKVINREPTPGVFAFVAQFESKTSLFCLSDWEDQDPMGILRLSDGVTTPTQEIQEKNPKVVPNIMQPLHRAVTLI